MVWRFSSGLNFLNQFELSLARHKANWIGPNRLRLNDWTRPNRLSQNRTVADSYWYPYGFLASSSTTCKTSRFVQEQPYAATNDHANIYHYYGVCTFCSGSSSLFGASHTPHNTPPKILLWLGWISDWTWTRVTTLLDCVKDLDMRNPWLQFWKTRRFTDELTCLFD